MGGKNLKYSVILDFLKKKFFRNARVDYHHCHILKENQKKLKKN